MKAFHAIVEGEVQGVGFRYSAAREARAIGLTGWVRNAEDGTVEVWAEGDSAELDLLIDWLRQGPSTAWVKNLRFTWENPTASYSSFGVAF